MNNKLTVAILLAVVLNVVGACQPTGTAPEIQKGQAETKPVSPAQQSWEADWQKTIAAAKEEGKVLIYTGASVDVQRELAAAFKGKYGIDMEFVSGNPAELETKITKERSAGLFLGDLVLSGPGSMVAGMKPKGLFDPIKPSLVLPEVLDPKVWWGEQGPIFIDTEEQYVVAGTYYEATTVVVNNELIKPSQLKSYRDLLDPAWKGKIVMADPTVPGQAPAVIQLWGWVIPGLGKDYVQTFVKQEPVMSRDRRLPAEWVARGRYPIGVGINQDVVADFVSKGAPLKWARMEEGTWLTGGLGCLSLLNKAPHPNAAKIFANWFLTREASTLYSRAVLSQSGRVDVATDFLDPSVVRVRGAKYYKESEKDHILRYEEVFPFTRQVFGPLLR